MSAKQKRRTRLIRAALEHQTLPSSHDGHRGMWVFMSFLNTDTSKAGLKRTITYCKEQRAKVRKSEYYYIKAR